MSKALGIAERGRFSQGSKEALGRKNLFNGVLKELAKKQNKTKNQKRRKRTQEYWLEKPARRRKNPSASCCLPSAFQRDARSHTDSVS